MVQPKRWHILLAGAAVFLCIGTIYAWSIFAAILHTSFISWTDTNLAVTFSIIMASFCVGNLAAGFISKKVGTKLVFALCAILVGLGFIGLSFIRENTLWLLYVSYGFVGSLGVGITYNLVLSIVTKWFPEKIGAASGTLLMCFALSTLFFGLGVQALSNRIDWRIIFPSVGIVIALVILLAAHVLKDPKTDAEFSKKTETFRNELAQKDMTISEMIKTGSFWLYFLWGMFFLVTIYSVQGNAKQIILDLDPKATILSTWVVMIFSICNGLGRLVLGALYDRFGRRVTMTVDTGLVILGAILMLISYMTHTLPAMTGGILLFGFAYGGVPSTSSAFVVDYYGAKDYSIKYGIISLYTFIGAFGSAFAGIIKDRAGSYSKMFSILIFIAIIATILNLFIKKSDARRKNR